MLNQVGPEILPRIILRKPWPFHYRGASFPCAQRFA